MIELMVVVAIIGVLSSIAIPLLSSHQLRTKSTEAYRKYLSLNLNTPRKEEIELGIALATAKTNPVAATPNRLQNG